MRTFTLIFSIVIAAVCFWSGIKLILLYFKVKAWEKVQALVISKKVELHKKVSSRNSPYGVRIEYKYNYHGKDYTNNKVYLVELIGGQVNHMESAAAKAINKIENQVVVYVNQKDPQESVLFCNGVGLYVVIFFFGIISLLISFSYYQ
ncbi:MAG: DUF3592 domain-containing protein [Bacteroidetes bacterium]|nr:DUF3592 domain-containing protein [Bacteroidota bacterium]